MPIRLAPQPPISGPSSTIVTRFVFATLSSTVSVSSGRRLRRSTTSALTPFSARAQAVAHALGDRDQGDVGALADHRRLTQWQHLVADDRVFDRVEALVLEE